MNCPVCGNSDSNVKFCRKCGASLNASTSEDTSAITRPMVREVVPFFPESGEPVVPIPKVSPRETTGVKVHDPSDIWDFSNFTTIEEPLRFTINEALIRAEVREEFQLRGLLRLKDEYEIYGYAKDGPYVQTVKDKHLELKFARSKTAPYVDRPYGQDINKIRIHLVDIESVSFKLRLPKVRLIVKCKYEHPTYPLEVDPIEREIVLYVSWKDAKLAKRYQSVIMTQLSDDKLKKLLRKI